MVWVISILLIMWLVFGLHHMLKDLEYVKEEER